LGHDGARGTTNKKAIYFTGPRLLIRSGPGPARHPPLLLRYWPKRVPCPAAAETLFPQPRSQFFDVRLRKRSRKLSVCWWAVPYQAAACTAPASRPSSSRKGGAVLWGQAASAYSLPRQGAPAMSPPIRGARAPRLSAKLCGVSTKRGLELKYRDVEYTVVQGIEFKRALTTAA
jgi:hypothetical protein